MFTDLEVIEQIKKGVSDRISIARNYADKINMHVTGLNLEAYIDKIEDFESDTNYRLKQRLIKSNKGVFSKVLRPLDKVFTAKGGGVNLNLSSNQTANLNNLISQSTNKLGVKDYIKSFVKYNYVIDPNGFVLIDLNELGEAEVRFINTNQVLSYHAKGNEIQHVIFEPYKEGKKMYYRVLDADRDVIFIRDGDNIYLDESSVKINPFGFVPAYIVGDRIDVNTGLFVSIVDDVIEEADELLRDTAVNTIHKLSHGYAKYWQYPENCTTCGGKGYLNKVVNGAVKATECHSCNGSGRNKKKKASDIILVDIPKEGDPLIAPNLGGYINPSIEIWKQYNEDIERAQENIFNVMWGSFFESKERNQTATGKFLNVQPQIERVANISFTFSKIHQFIVKALGVIITGDITYSPEVSYGTRYLIDSPDKLLQTISEAKEKKISENVQLQLLDRFYQTEYCNNNLEYQKAKKLQAVDPFPTLTVLEVKELQETIPQTDYYQKIYYSQWVNQLDETKKIIMTAQELKADLLKYVELKININATT